MILKPGTTELIPRPGTNELFVNNNFQHKDLKQRRVIVCTAMILDGNLFLEAGNQDQLDPKDFCKFFK